MLKNLNLIFGFLLVLKFQDQIDTQDHCFFRERLREDVWFKENSSERC